MEKSRRMRWEVNVARIVKRNAYWLSVGSQKVRGQHVGGGIILSCIFERGNGMVWL
jgi:hypothetical protein